MFFDGEKVGESSSTTNRISESSKAMIGHDGLGNYTVGEAS